MKLILDGGKFNETTINLLKELSNNKKPLLYIPFAWRDKTYKGCKEWLSEQIKAINYPYIDMVTSINELNQKELSYYSVIFIGGGNTYSLLKDLKESNFINKIKEYLNNDGILCGSSAGAIICGKDIDVISKMDPNDVKLNNTLGLNLLNNISIFPHYTNKSKNLTETENKQIHDMYTNYLLNYSKTNKVIAIPEEDTIYYDNEQIEMLGTLPYYIFDNEKIIKKDITKKKRK